MTMMTLFFLGFCYKEEVKKKKRSEEAKAKDVKEYTHQNGRVQENALLFLP